MRDFKKTNSFSDNRGGSSYFPRGNDRQVESHKTTCDGCHAMCEVPFKPNGKKPVYCRNCYKGKETTTSFTGQPFTYTEKSNDDANSGDLKKQFSILNTKLDRLISAIEAQTRAMSSTRD